MSYPGFIGHNMSWFVSDVTNAKAKESRERLSISCYDRETKNVLHHHPVVCLTTGSKPLPKRSLHILRSRAFAFKWKYPLLSLKSSSSFLRLLPCLLITYISPFISPSITCFRRQFLRKMWPSQLAFRFLIWYMKQKKYLMDCNAFAKIWRKYLAS